MRRIIIPLFIFLLILCAVSAAAQGKQGKDAGKNSPPMRYAPPGVTLCPFPTHGHRMSDLRLALVEVKEPGLCGFTYVDLEDYSVSAEPLIYESGFAVADVDCMPNGGPCLAKPTGSKPSKGDRLVIIYCSHCKAVLNGKLVK